MSSKISSTEPTIFIPETFIDPETYYQHISKIQIEADVLLKITSFEQFPAKQEQNPIV